MISVLGADIVIANYSDVIFYEKIQCIARMNVQIFGWVVIATVLVYGTTVVLLPMRATS